jgi:hypothetical protein
LLMDGGKSPTLPGRIVSLRDLYQLKPNPVHAGFTTMRSIFRL